MRNLLCFFLFIFLVSSLLAMPFVSATFGYSNSDTPKLESPTKIVTATNNNTLNVNHSTYSDYWDNLNTPADISYDDLSGGDVEAAGYTGYFAFLAGTVGAIDMTGSPWWFSGTSLELERNLDINQNLTLGGYILSNLIPSPSLTLNLGSGANRWNWLYVANISTEGISTFDLEATEKVTAPNLCYSNGTNCNTTSLSTYNSTYNSFSNSPTINGNITLYFPTQNGGEGTYIKGQHAINIYGFYGIEVLNNAIGHLYGRFVAYVKDNNVDTLGLSVDALDGVSTPYSFNSTIADGNIPIKIVSTTMNPNLNADLLDGYHWYNMTYSGSIYNSSYVEHNVSQSIFFRGSNLTVINGLISSAGTEIQADGDLWVNASQRLWLRDGNTYVYSTGSGTMYLGATTTAVFVTPTLTIDSSVAQTTTNYAKLNTVGTIITQKFDGFDYTNATTTYAKVFVNIKNNSNTFEDGSMTYQVLGDGSLENYLVMDGSNSTIYVYKNLDAKNITSDNITIRTGLGIGNSPLANRSIYIVRSYGNDSSIRLALNLTTVIASSSYGGIEWEGRDSSTPGTTDGTRAQIIAHSEGLLGQTGVRIYTRDTGALMERVRIMSSGKVGIGTGDYPPLYQLQVGNQSGTNYSDISIWAVGNVSAGGYLSRTELYDSSKGSALDQIKDASEYLDSKGEINHSAYGYSYSPYKTQKVVNYDKDTGDYIYEDTMEEAISLDKEIALLKQAVYELKVMVTNSINRITGAEERIINLEKENQRIRNCAKEEDYKLYKECVLK